MQLKIGAIMMLATVNVYPTGVDLSIFSFSRSN